MSFYKVVQEKTQKKTPRTGNRKLSGTFFLSIKRFDNEC